MIFLLSFQIFEPYLLNMDRKNAVTKIWSLSMFDVKADFQRVSITFDQSEK